MMRSASVGSRRLRKFVWFTRALLSLAVVRFGLTFLSYNRIAGFLPSRPSGAPFPAPPDVVARCQWAITRAAAFVPEATCLTQAVAGRWLLARQGYETVIVIGVAPDKVKGPFRAHAWLKSGDAIVVGGTEENLEDFTPLTKLGTPS